MSAFRAALPPDRVRRFLIVDDFNLGQLFATCAHVVTLCSQAGLEAARAGLKPVVLGNAFYSRAGFTTDYDEPEDFVRDLARGAVPGTLDLDGYRAFCDFLTLLMQYHTVAVTGSGKRTLRRLFGSYSPIPHPEGIRSELSLQPTWAEVPPEVFGEAVRPRTPLTKDACKEELGRLIEFRLKPANGARPAPGGLQTMRLMISNRSDFVLPAQHSPDFRLNFSYHLRDEAGNMVVWNGRRTRLSADVAHFHRQEVAVELPPAPGRYTLQPALVLEGVAWLNGSEAVTLDVAPGAGERP